MIAIHAYEPWHIAALAVQEAQAGEMALATLAPAVNAELGPAFSAMEEGDGAPRVLCCAGLVVNNPAWATAWAMFAEAKGPGMVSVTRAIRRVIDAAGYRRIDMSVRSGFERARDYARLLGFAQEATLDRLDAAGNSYEVWVRFRGDA